MRRMLILVLALTAAAVLAPTAGAQAAVPRAADYAIIARDIMPSGEYGTDPPPANAARQAQMYNALTPLFNNVTPSDW